MRQLLAGSSSSGPMQHCPVHLDTVKRCFHQTAGDWLQGNRRLQTHFQVWCPGSGERSHGSSIPLRRPLHSPHGRAASLHTLVVTPIRSLAQATAPASLSQPVRRPHARRALDLGRPVNPPATRLLAPSLATHLLSLIANSEAHRF